MTIATASSGEPPRLEHVDTQARILTEALGREHAGAVAGALGTVARARGIAAIAAETGLNRPALHKALSDRGNPTLATLLKVLHALGLQLTVSAREPQR